MRQLFISASLIFLSANAWALTNDKDTLGTRLQEVVVEGRTQRILDSGVEYTPDKTSKKFAQDAISLLENMQIPQLTIHPDNSIRSNDGKNVKIFIDYIEASPADIEGLRPEDVRRVEVLDFPKDVRFKNEEHVVNFIMQKYEWGGYTKLRLTGRVLEQENIKGGLYQKFIYKDWSFDVAASGQGDWHRNDKDFISENYKNFNFNGTHIDEVTRISETDRFRERNNDEDVSFRFAYGKDNIYVGHTLAYSRQATPTSERNSHVDFSRPVLPSSTASDRNDALILYYWANGNYFFSMPKKNSLSVNWSAGHSGNHLNRVYDLNGEAPIENRSKTSFNFFWIVATYSKQLNHRNSIGLNIYTNNNFFDTDYTGSYTGNTKVTNSFTRAEATYNQRWNFGLSVMARAGVIYTLNRQNDINNSSRWTPRGYVRVGYTFNPKSSLYATWNLTSGIPGTDDVKDVVQRENELLWTMGNPLLHGGIFNSVSIGYNYMPAKIFSLNVTGIYKNYNKVPVSIFETLPGYDGIVRTLSDDNREQDLTAAASFNLFLLNRKLVFGGGIECHYQVNRGIHPLSDTNVAGFINARYSFSNFTVRGFFTSGERSINDTQGFIKHIPCRYGVSVAYSVGEFKASVKFNNWFSHGKSLREYSSVHYDYSAWIWDSNMARAVMLDLTYTFPYGKKVDRNNEIEAGHAGKI